MYCKDCKFYEAGYDGKPGICQKLRVANTWESYKNLPKDGVGYSDKEWSEEFADLYVGEEFGCVKFEGK